MVDVDAIVTEKLKRLLEGSYNKKLASVGPAEPGMLTGAIWWVETFEGPSLRELHVYAAGGRYLMGMDHLQENVMVDSLEEGLQRLLGKATPVKVDERLIENRLKAFLYVLLRDEVTPGSIERILIQEAKNQGFTLFEYSDKPLADRASRYAERLLDAWREKDFTTPPTKEYEVDDGSVG